MAVAREERHMPRSQEGPVELMMLPTELLMEILQVSSKERAGHLHTSLV